MSMMKRFAEDVATSMGKEEIDEEVLQEAQRRLDTMNHRIIRDLALTMIRARVQIYGIIACRDLLEHDDVVAARRAAVRALHYEDLHNWAIRWFE